MKKFKAFLLAAIMIFNVFTLSACGTGTSGSGDTKGDTEQSSADDAAQTYEDAVQIALSDDGVTVDGEAISTDESDAVYTANDIVFYLEGQDFTYGEGTEEDEHSQAEADGHTVVHITKAGTYAVSGKLSAGQIAIDLGDEAEEDPEAVVTLVLNGADITCTVAPAVIFYNVYECGSSDTEGATKDVDTSAAGANVVIADGTENNINGSHVARIYKPDSVVLSDDGTEVEDSKKLHKYDAAFYSKKTMNVSGGTKGDGILNINADNEGLDSELHLTIGGGNINIESGNDGINTNEDGVSVTTINGGSVNIYVNGSTGEGDGIDSNGWLVINGGTVIASACSISGDAGIDSDNGIHINGGTVIAGGNMLDRISGAEQTYAVFEFAASQKGGKPYVLRNADGKDVITAELANDFRYLIVSSADMAAGEYTLWCGDTQYAVGGSGMGGMNGMGGFRPGFGGMQMPNGEMPENMEIPEGMELPEGMEIPENGERPEFPEEMERPDMGERPEMPDGGELPEGMTPPDGAQMPGGGRGQIPGGQTSDSATVIFTIVEGENYFSGVTESVAPETDTNEGETV